MGTKIGDMAVYISANTGQLASDLKKGGDLIGGFSSAATKKLADAARPPQTQADWAALFRSGERAAADSAKGIRSSLSGIFQHAAGDLLAGGIRSAAAGIGGLVKSSVDLAAAAEVAGMKFEVILGSAKEAGALMGDLKDFAAKSPVSYADSMQHATKLLSAQVDRGQVTPTLRALSELSMGDPQSLKQAVLAYSQVKTTGMLQGDEWNQIANLGTLNLADIAKVMKVPGRENRPVDESEMKKMIEDGKVGFYDLQRAIKAATDEGGRFYGLSAKYAETYSGKLDKLKDDWDEVKRGFGKVIIDELSLKGAADSVGSMKDGAKALAESLRLPLRMLKEMAGVTLGVFDRLYKFGRNAALLFRGELETFRKGEAAAADNAAQEAAAKINVEKHGIDIGAGFDLAAQKKTAEDMSTRIGHADQILAEKLAFQKRWADAGSPGQMQDQIDIIRGRIAGYVATRDAAQKKIAEILKMSDPTKITRDEKGAYLPKKPELDGRLARLGLQIDEHFGDPVGKFRQGEKDLADVLKAGKIDGRTHALAYAELVRGVEKQLGGAGPPRLAEGVELGSSQLASMVAQAFTGQGPQDVPGLLKRLTELMEQQVRESQELVKQGGRQVPVANMGE